MLDRPRRMTLLLVIAAILALSATPLASLSVSIGLDLSETTVTWQRAPSLPPPILPAIVFPRPERRPIAQDRALPLSS
jgi:hypothetical protein